MEMSLIVSTRIVDFLMLILITGSVIIFLELGKKRRFTLKDIPAIYALEEGVARAVEMGKAVTWTEGHPQASNLQGSSGPYLLAGLSILSQVASHCARLGGRLITCVGHPELYPLTHEAVRMAYVMEGKPEDFKPDDILFLPTESYTPAMVGVLEREQPAMHVSAGAFYWQDSMLIPETAAGIGAFQVAGGPTGSIPYFIMSCDYTLIGDEMFTMEAIISKDPARTASVIAQDVPKLLSIIIIIAACILYTLGYTFIVDIIKM